MANIVLNYFYLTYLPLSYKSYDAFVQPPFYPLITRGL